MSLSKTLLEDLERSGLKQRDALAMQLAYYDEKQTRKFSGYDGLISFAIPYFSLDSSRIASEDFIRLRFLSDAEALVQAGLKANQKYWQTTGSDNKLYLPPPPKGMKPWKEVAKDPSVRIIILEGEKKAYASMLAGEYTIGLSGVNSWVRRVIEEGLIKTDDGGLKLKNNKKRGRPQREISEPLKDFALFVWSRREVVIAFDWPDIRINRSVRRTLERFTAFLVRQGANCKALEFGQDTSDSKVGADDYIVANGREAYRDLIKAAEPMQTDGLSRMRARYIKIIIPVNTYYDRDARQLISANDFHGSTKEFTTYDDEGKSQPASTAFDLAPVKATRLVYRPGYDPMAFIDDDEPIDKVTRAFNVWPGEPAEPKKGDVSPLLEVFKLLREINEPEAVKVFEQWCAWPLRNPTRAKMKLAVVLYSKEQGTGKTLTCEVIARAYNSKGVAFVVARDLHGGFNYWAKDRQFIVANEATSWRTDAEQLKATITDTSIWINTKNVHTYEIDNRFNLIFTTNRLDALAIDEGDRRFLILRFPVLPPSLIQRLIKLRDAPDTSGALLWFFKNAVDLERFDPGARPPMTYTKQSFADSYKDEWVIFAQGVRDNPRETLAEFYREAMGDKEMTAAYRNHTGRQILNVGEERKMRTALNEVLIPFRQTKVNDTGPHKDDKDGSPYNTPHRLWWVDAKVCSGMTLRELNDWYCDQITRADKDRAEIRQIGKARVIEMRPKVPGRETS